MPQACPCRRRVASEQRRTDHSNPATCQMMLAATLPLPLSAAMASAI